MHDAKVLDLSVGEIMSRWPATIGVFVDWRMHCIGCPISLFHTLPEAAAEHHVPLDALLADIELAMQDRSARPA